MTDAEVSRLVGQNLRRALTKLPPDTSASTVDLSAQVLGHESIEALGAGYTSTIVAACLGAPLPHSKSQRFVFGVVPSTVLKETLHAAKAGYFTKFLQECQPGAD
jgi:hypothetical protein